MKSQTHCHQKLLLTHFAFFFSFCTNYTVRSLLILCPFIAGRDSRIWSRCLQTWAFPRILSNRHTCWVWRPGRPAQSGPTKVRLCLPANDAVCDSLHSWCEHLPCPLWCRQRGNSLSKRSVWLPDVSRQLQISGQPEVKRVFGQSYDGGQQSRFHSFIRDEALKTIQEPSQCWILFVEVYVLYVELEEDLV